MDIKKFETLFKARKNYKLLDEDCKLIILASVGRVDTLTKQVVCMEEMAELQQQISKSIRGENNRMELLEEMADVAVCLEYLKIIHEFTDDDLKSAIQVKLERENERCKLDGWNIRELTRDQLCHALKMRRGITVHDNDINN